MDPWGFLSFWLPVLDCYVSTFVYPFLGIAMDQLDISGVISFPLMRRGRPLTSKAVSFCSGAKNMAAGMIYGKSIWEIYGKYMVNMGNIFQHSDWLIWDSLFDWSNVVPKTFNTGEPNTGNGDDIDEFRGSFRNMVNFWLRLIYLWNIAVFHII